MPRGAQRDGPWIRGNTWDLTRKIQVQGDVAWPNARFTITVAGGERRVTGNGLPIDHNTGIFPVQRSDLAAQIDPNPNSIQVQQVEGTMDNWRDALTDRSANEVTEYRWDARGNCYETIKYSGATTAGVVDRAAAPRYTYARPEPPLALDAAATKSA